MIFTLLYTAESKYQTEADFIREKVVNSKLQDLLLGTESVYIDDGMTFDISPSSEVLEIIKTQYPEFMFI